MYAHEYSHIVNTLGIRHLHKSSRTQIHLLHHQDNLQSKHTYSILQSTIIPTINHGKRIPMKHVIILQSHVKLKENKINVWVGRSAKTGEHTSDRDANWRKSASWSLLLATSRSASNTWSLLLAQRATPVHEKSALRVELKIDPKFHFSCYNS